MADPSRERVSGDALNDLLRDAELGQQLHYVDGLSVVQPNGRQRHAEMAMMSDEGVLTIPVVLAMLRLRRIPDGHLSSVAIGIPLDAAADLARELITAIEGVS